MPKSATQPIMEELRTMTEPAPSIPISDLQQPNFDTSKGKELVLYNPFDALTLDDDKIVDDKIEGPKEYNPSREPDRRSNRSSYWVTRSLVRSAITRKLKALKPVQQRKKGDHALNVKLVAEFLSIAQSILQTDRHNLFLKQLENYCRLVFLKATKMEQQMLHQRAKMQWLKGRDQCTRIFFRKVNATLLALIPKVQSPTTVADFRLIFYCNVLYKTITKILVQQIRPLFDRLLFGFHPQFIQWIEECVTTSSFSMSLNGSIHRFFLGDADLTFHWKCSEIGLFQLSFNDDLLLFSSADENSMGIFKLGLQLFASLFGLCANPKKSQLIISKSAQSNRDPLLQSVGFREGVLQVRYLGLPLLALRLTTSDCQLLFQKIEKRINGWTGIPL
ncbi:hypothetical protein Sango_1254300 [Sesamum angolense]|uniref:Reverse transcriptase domain-containing protein n=1 Tax=Sesamum angolense TaxID=2727404 RepID=A0AAE2BU85_9LAMI|nr:hypothetical protein Sango_1254300 [Sesamum angolense]